MRFFAFIAGFFRESGSTESSTRLVGILSFTAAIFMSVYVVVRPASATAEAIGVIVTNFTYGSIALGLRKSGDGKLPAKGEETPTAVVPSSVENTVTNTPDTPAVG